MISPLDRFLNRVFAFLMGSGNPNQNLGMNGDLDDIEMIKSVEDRFKVKFSEGEVYNLRTVGDLFELLSKHKRTKDPKGLWHELLEVVVHFGMLPIEEIRPNTEFFYYKH